MKKAKQGFGGDDFICLKDWPDDCYVQCGDSGIVFNSSSDNSSYITAFFESFPKNPKTFIRGEGANIEEAEANAWDKFQRILACEEHEYKRHGKEHGTCIKCGLFTSEVFCPSESCSVCNKPEVNYQLSFNALNFKYQPVCREHYIQKIPYMESLSEDFLESMDYMDRKYHFYELKNMRMTKYFLDNKIIDISLPEYIEANRVDKMSMEFITFIHNSILKVLNLINKDKPESEQYRYRMIEFKCLKDDIISNKDYLYLLLDHYFDKKSFEDLLNTLSNPIIEKYKYFVERRRS